MRVKAIGLDLDDTLYPEREFVRSGFSAVAEAMAGRLGCDAEEIFSELFSLFEEGVRGQTFNVWLQKRGLPEDLATEMVRVYRNHFPDLRPYPDVEGFLHRVKERGLYTALISDGHLATQRNKLRALGLEKWFDVVFFTDTLGREFWKPNPFFYGKAIDLFCIPPQSFVYVGDNPQKDFKGARELGLRTVRIRRKDGLYAGTEAPGPEYEPDFTISSLAELIGMLESGV